MKSPALVLIAVLLAGCAAADASEVVCDDFAAHARDGLPADERPEVVRSLGEDIAEAEPSIREAHDALLRTVGGSDSSYQLAADAFATACFDNGWEG